MSIPKPQLDALLLQIPQLSPKQAAQVWERLTFLLGSVDTHESDYWLLDGAYAELKRRGLLSGKGPPMRIVKTWGVSMSTSFIDAQTFLLNTVGRDLNPAEKSALSQLCFAALCDWLTDKNLTPSLRMLVLNVNNIPVALDASFPGYVAMALGMLLKKKSIKK